MRYFKELKCRLILTFYSYIFSLIICYYYKEILYLILLTIPIFKNNFKFYFVFTNIVELFLMYYKLIKFCSFQILIYYLTYHSFNFLMLAFRKTEFLYIKYFLNSLIFIWLTINILYNFYFFPVIFTYFSNLHNLFNKNTLFFEIKLNEHIKIYMNVFYVMFFSFNFLFLNFLVLKEINLNLLIKTRKLIYYFFSFILILILNLFESLFQLYFILKFIIMFELLIFYKHGIKLIKKS
jgi:hypothetical protein